MPTTKKNKITSTRVALTSFLVDVSDILLNLLAALLSGSVVLTTQWLQGVADLVASGLTLTGVHRSQKPPDKNHPFGYGRELFFWTLIAGLFMFIFTSGLSFYLGWRRIMNPQPLTNLPFAYFALIFGFTTNGYSLSLSLRRLIGTYPKPQLRDVVLHSSLMGAKTTLILDLTGTLASALGLFALFMYGITGQSHFDGYGAIAISLVLFTLAFFLLLNIRDLIIGRSASDKTQKNIIAAVRKVPEVIKVLDIRTAIIGPEKILVNLELHLKQHLTTKQIEQLIDKIKTLVKKEVPTIENLTIELETPDKDIPKA